MRKSLRRYPWVSERAFPCAGPPLAETFQLLAPMASSLKTLNLSGNEKMGNCEMPIAEILQFTVLETLGLSSLDLHGTCS